MARRTTVVLTADDERALREASRAEGVSQSQLIRRGILLVTRGYRSRKRLSTGWLSLSDEEEGEIEREAFGDDDA